MSQKTMKELQQDQELLRAEVNQLKSQMNQIMEILQILLKREDNFPFVVTKQVGVPIVLPNSTTVQRKYHPVSTLVPSYGPSPKDLPPPLFSKIPDQQSLSALRQSQGNHQQDENLNKPLKKQQKRPCHSTIIPMKSVGLFPQRVRASQPREANQNQNRDMTHFDPIPMSY